METSAKTPGRAILQQVVEQHPAALSQQNPMVLSCGGIYIPRRAIEVTRLPYALVNTISPNETAKVVGTTRPRNLLHEIIRKESAN